MVCISVWLRIGLSRYTVLTLGASKPVSHIAQTNTSFSGSPGSLNFSSSFSRTMRSRCGTMSRPLAAISSISFWPGDTITAMSTPSIAASRWARSARSASVVPGISSLDCAASCSAAQYRRTLSCMRTVVALSIATTIALP